LVATIQLAITLGAALGGLILDKSGALGVFILSCIFLMGATITSIFTN
jgi:predicted MFS family arabinose efflux permease